MALYAAGDITWAYLELVLQRPVFPSLADAFYLSYFPFFLIGVLPLVSGQGLYDIILL